MKKTYFIKDEDGQEYKVEEVEKMEEAHDEEPAPEKSAETHDELALSEDELAALKSLAAVADKLVAMVQDVHDEDKDCEDEDCEDDDDVAELVDEDEEEKLIDTDEEDDKKKAKDSKKSFGSVEKKMTKTNDSYEDRELEIAKAWNARLNGGKQ